MKKQRSVLAIVFMALFSNCNNARMNGVNSPLATVIKLNSAESLMDFEEAKKYQDVNNIYGKYSKEILQSQRISGESLLFLLIV